jgi:hypothetical protein
MVSEPLDKSSLFQSRCLGKSKSGFVRRLTGLYQLGGDLDQEFALGVRKFRPELCNRASCDAGVPIGDGS